MELNFDTAKAIDLLIALVFLLVGIYVVNVLTRLLQNRMNKDKYSPPVPYFLSTFIKISLYVILVISFMSKIGIPTQSFLAVLGAAGLALGLALQGHISNLAGGILILLFKPFKIGDRITALGNTGRVYEIKTFFTILKTANKQTLYLPNGPLFNGVLTNHTEEGFSRIEYVIGVAYKTDLDFAIECIENLLKSRNEVLQEEPIKAFVEELSDSAVTLRVFFHVPNEILWDVRFEMLKEIKKELDRNQIEIPFPQRVVYKAP